MVCRFNFSQAHAFLAHKHKLIIHCALISKMTQKQDKCFETQTLYLLGAGLMRGVSCEHCCHSSSRLIVKQDDTDNCLLHPCLTPNFPFHTRGLPSFHNKSSWVLCHVLLLSHQHLIRLCVNALIVAAWMRKVRGLKGKSFSPWLLKPKCFFPSFFPGNQASKHWCKIGAFCVYHPIVSPYKSSTPTPDTWYHGPFVTHVYVWDVECCRDGMLPSPPPRPPPPSEGCGCCLDRRHRELGGAGNTSRVGKCRDGPEELGLNRLSRPQGTQVLSRPLERRKKMSEQVNEWLVVSHGK